jgi:uncharacterized protein YfdQ (DUF2303 family)
MSHPEEHNLLDSAVKHLPKVDLVGQIPGPTGDDDDELRLYAVPAGYKLEHVDTEKLLPHPRRLSAKAVVDDLESFVRYVQRHATAATVVWAKLNPLTQALSLLAVIDEHTLDLPSWRAHSVLYVPAASVEWARWTAHDRKPMSQVDFALWLEDNGADIPTIEGLPTGADMLAMALQFEAKQDMRLKSHVRLQNGGVQLEYVADDDSATLQRMEMFDRFSIGIPVFWGGDRYRIDAKLRYRAREGKATFWYELQRPDRVHEDAARGVLTKVREQLPEQPLLLGQL